MAELKLDDLRTGEKGKIVKILGNGSFRIRLMELGFVPGAEVKVVRYAPLKDPVEYEIKGYHITLRHEEAAQILVKKLD
ncbi:FeoA family protein [Thermodesulfatator indicus DSM 15286]|uniref:FeoA family protein n=1 Tax=Thermodesulfatator indicus (strain DSM 15286 / JCM 11887 / CIR29812) TaxID=667014 RepID=F8AAA1_THEID|nr:FeoA family protein [Thermodesulfatator indicus]AEH44237.1 FeoA family protein [Thermodesulfatator indicus DSM 15286]